MGESTEESLEFRGHTYERVPGFPQRLQAALTARNLPANRLATHAGMQAGQVYAWLHGTSEPRVAFLMVLARTLRVRTDWLLGLKTASDPAFDDERAVETVAEKILAQNPTGKRP